MSSQTKNIINNANTKKDKYSILTFDTHERYQTELAKTGHDFYAFRYEGCKEWDETYSKKPSNYYTLPENTVFGFLDFDFILTQSKFGQFQAAQAINRTLGLPIISLEHTLPIPSWPDEQTNAFRQMTGDINVFISDYSAGVWNMNTSPTVITHCVDTEVFKPKAHKKNKSVLSVVNDFANRDYCCNYSGWQRITKGLPVKLVGNSPGLSEPAKDTEELVSEYQKAGVFLNTSTVSPVPTSLLEAMACGCAVVSTATCMIPEIIENGVNGFISNDEDELRKCVEMLLAEPELAGKMGHSARNTILQKFSEEDFTNNWNKVFDLAHGMKK